MKTGRCELVLLFRLLHGNSKSNFGAHSRAEFTMASAAAPSATVKPMTANLMKRRAVGWTTTTVPRWASSVRCCCSFRLWRSTTSGRCCVDASSKSLNVETAVLVKNKSFLLLSVVEIKRPLKQCWGSNESYM